MGYQGVRGYIFLGKILQYNNLIIKIEFMYYGKKKWYSFMNPEHRFEYILIEVFWGLLVKTLLVLKTGEEMVTLILVNSQNYSL